MPEYDGSYYRLFRFVLRIEGASAPLTISLLGESLVPSKAQEMGVRKELSVPTIASVTAGASRCFGRTTIAEILKEHGILGEAHLRIAVREYVAHYILRSYSRRAA